MMFCPTCGNLVLIRSTIGSTEAFCSTCPYQHRMNHVATTYVPLKKKKKAEVLGQDWANANKISVVCDKCHNKMAYFFEVQIRSADEPMTRFYKCTKCGEQWNDE